MCILVIIEIHFYLYRHTKINCIWIRYDAMGAGVEKPITKQHIQLCTWVGWQRKGEREDLSP